MKRIFVTGITGFVGSYLREYPEVLPNNGSVVDVRDHDRLRACIERGAPDAVIHLAAQSNIPQSFKDPLETYHVNFLGTHNLLTTLTQLDFSGVLLFVGTGDVYGKVPAEQLPIVEDQAPRPTSPYAVSKLAAEALCYEYSLRAGFKIVMARPFNHFGPRQSENFAISQFAKQIARIRLERQPAVIKTGDLSVTRDFTDVRDIVRAYMSLIRFGAHGEVYNVCSGVERSLKDIVLQMGEIAEVQFDIETQAMPVRKAEQQRAVGSLEKIHQATGWCPQMPFRDSLCAVIDYWVDDQR